MRDNDSNPKPDPENIHIHLNEWYENKRQQEELSTLGAEKESVAFTELRRRREEIASQIAEILLPQIRKWIATKVPHEDRDSVSIESLYRIFKSRPNDPFAECGNAIGWAKSITENAHADYWRKQKSKTQSIITSFSAAGVEDDSKFEDEESRPENILMIKERRELLYTILESAPLSTRNREILILKMLKEFSYSDIAMLYEISESRARSVVSESIAVIKKFWGSQFP